jgi:alpha-glucosidase
LQLCSGPARPGRPRFFSLFLALLAFTSAAIAQDERSLTSPDGQIEFRLGYAQPDPDALFQLAYQVLFHGKTLIETSFLGLQIHNQEPILGAKLGLTGSHSGQGPGYRFLVAEYLQNGSLGRRITIEARAFNDGIAFRYVIPKSLPLDEILIEDEVTEFSFAQDIKQKPSALPFVVARPGLAWTAITEVASPNYPPMSLVLAEPNTLATHLARLRGDPILAYQGTTPLTSPWRVLLINAVKAHLLESSLLKSLEQ